MFEFDNDTDRQLSINNDALGFIEVLYKNNNLTKTQYDSCIDYVKKKH